MQLLNAQKPQESNYTCYSKKNTWLQVFLIQLNKPLIQTVMQLCKHLKKGLYHSKKKDGCKWILFIYDNSISQSMKTFWSWLTCWIHPLQHQDQPTSHSTCAWHHRAARAKLVVALAPLPMLISGNCVSFLCSSGRVICKPWKIGHEQQDFFKPKVFCKQIAVYNHFFFYASCFNFPSYR